uniref:Uncharacterized protein LOC100176290 n=1 Tax=Phallusia mammillata TaxID=59560 RepID=A0A6F9DGN1_9ASCI|nr:uncharacterized protein LOC100176290 [Phallusia mammillata]
MEHSIWKNNVISGERPDLELVPNPSPKELVHCMIQSWKQRPEDRPEFYEIYKQLHPFPYEAAFIERLVTGLLLSPNLNPKRFLPAQVSAPTATNRHAHPHTLERRTGDFSPSVFNFDRSEDQTVAKQPVNLHVHPSQSSNWHDSGNASLASSGQNVRLNTGEFSHTICSDEAPLIQTSIPELNETEAVQPTNSKRFGGCCKATRIVPAVLVIVAIGVAFPFVYLHLARGGPCPSLPSPDQYKSISCHPPVNPGANQVASGTVCEIFCKTGYGIKNGSSQITCEKPGIWSESKPVCSKLAVCPSLPDPANGGSTNCTDSSYEMSVCQFSCPPGFRLRYESSAGLNIDSKTSTTCRVTSGTAKWDLPVPYCEKVSVCPSLPNPTTGKYDCNAVSVTSVAGTSYNNGTICNLDCYQGYAVDGNNAVQCQDNSAWNKTKLFCQQSE